MTTAFKLMAYIALITGIPVITVYTLLNVDPVLFSILALMGFILLGIQIAVNDCHVRFLPLKVILLAVILILGAM